MTAGYRELSGQALAAFGAASGQNAATTNGRHTAAEAMTALADQFARLIRAFHVSSPLSKIKVRCIRAQRPEVNGWHAFWVSFFFLVFKAFQLSRAIAVASYVCWVHIQRDMGLLH